MESTVPLIPRKPSAADSLRKPSKSNTHAGPNRPRTSRFLSETAPSDTVGGGSATTANASGLSKQPLGQADRAEQRSSSLGLRASHEGTAGPSARTEKQKTSRTKVINEATATVVVIGAERDSVPFRLCCEALAEGCVQTYMHLFDLAHRDPVCVDTLSRKFFSVPDDRLAWVQQQLSAVETLRRQSEFAQVLDRCQETADYFEVEGDYAEALWCHMTALQYMVESLDRSLEQKSRKAYAMFQERQGHLDEAAALYEATYSLAVALKDEATMYAACRCIYRVHQALGDAIKFSDPVTAARHYAKAAEAAERSESGHEEGAAYSALGDVSEARGNLPLALKYQRSYRTVAQANDLKEDECHATLRVADLADRLGLKIEASTNLQDALKLAKEIGSPRQLSIATMQLGEAYRTRCQEDHALECFNESFSAAMEADDQELLDTARIAMGFARGDYYLTHAYDGKGYLHLVCTDIRAQLAWMSSGTL